MSDSEDLSFPQTYDFEAAIFVEFSDVSTGEPSLPVDNVEIGDRLIQIFVISKGYVRPSNPHFTTSIGMVACPVPS